ncbi:MAG TPA: hypothetical protein GX522_01760 [Firmicutes bacterium]|nr:hypothetical protein [Bacillota bacterium]
MIKNLGNSLYSFSSVFVTRISLKVIVSRDFMFDVFISHRKKAGRNKHVGVLF